MESADQCGMTYLLWASVWGNESVAKLLLNRMSTITETIGQHRTEVGHGAV